MASRSLNFWIAAGLVFAGGSEPAFANKPDRPEPRGTTYLAEPLVDEQASAELLAKRNGSLAEYRLRPELKIVLNDALDPKLGKRMAMHRSQPLVAGTPLFGWRDWPGLYCDLMRNRGLGSSAICLRDNDDDGAFDDVVRLDFNSATGDLVFITDKGKVRGGYFKREAALPAPLAYERVDGAERPEGRVHLVWELISANRDDSAAPVLIDLLMTDGPNFTGTEILSETLLRVPFRGEPVTVEFNGAEIDLLGLTEDNQLRYRIRPKDQPAPVKFVFRGYVMNIIFIP